MMQAMIFLPLILAASVVSFAGAMSLHVTEKTNAICRKGLLNTEAHAIEKLEALRSLNPTARILRGADKVSKLTMVIPFYGQLTAVSLQEARIIFHMVQLGIIRSANLEMKNNLLRTTQDLRQVNDFGIQNFVKSEVVNSPTLAVDARPKENLTPDYQPKIDFAELMTTQLKWTLQLEKMFPAWLVDLLNDQKLRTQDFNLTLTCASSTQKKENNQWQPSLTEKTQNQYAIIKAKQLLSWY